MAELLRSAGSLVILEAPRGLQFGVDLKTWQLDSEFLGLKLVPPGLHFVHYAGASSDTSDAAHRVGFMHVFEAEELLVKKWDKKNEDISTEPVSDILVERLKANLCNIDKNLAPYPFDIYNKWKSLTCHITNELIRKMTPEDGKIRSALELVSYNNDERPKGENRVRSQSKDKDVNNTSEQSEGKSQDGIQETNHENSTEIVSIEQKSENAVETGQKLHKRRSRTRTAEEKEDELLPHLRPIPGTEIRFTTFPDRIYPCDATPSEITKHHLDQTYKLELMIKTHSKSMDIIGELQFSFVCFLIGHSLEAFEHWKKMVHLFCSCEDALTKYYNIYFQFITTLEIQLMEIPEEFLADIVMNENFVYVSLKKFFKTVYSATIEAKLKTLIERFQFKLTEKFMWHFGDLEVEEDDELPVIVHLNDCN